MRSCLPVTWACVLAAIAGCGAIGDHLIDGPVRHVPLPYGGVREDVQSIAYTAKNVVTGDSPRLAPKVLIEEVGGMFAIADLPLSAIADTILLPVTLRNAFREREEDHSE